MMMAFKLFLAGWDKPGFHLVMSYSNIFFLSGGQGEET